MAMIQLDLYRAQCRRLKKHYKSTKSRIESTRCWILSLLNEGKSVKEISKLVDCVRATIYYTIYRFEDMGENAIYDRRINPGRRKITEQVKKKILSYLDKSPKDYDWHGATWPLELISLQLRDDLNINLSKSCICGYLKELGCKRKRPGQVLRIPVKGRKKRLEKIGKIVKKASAKEEVFYSDEADIDLNPKFGDTYSKRGHQTKVVTPGKNQKRYIAGALNARTGKIV